jgi:aspartate racemase
MEQGFYIDRLQEGHGLQVLVPNPEDREIVHRVIYDELCLGRVLPTSRAEYRRVIAELKTRGAQAVILGCTEIALLVGPEDAEIPLFDTTRIHARSAAEWALAAE